MPCALMVTRSCPAVRKKRRSGLLMLRRSTRWTSSRTWTRTCTSCRADGREVAGDTSKRTLRPLISLTTLTESTVSELRLTKGVTPLKPEVHWTLSTRLAQASTKPRAARPVKLLTAVPSSNKSKCSEMEEEIYVCQSKQFFTEFSFTLKRLEMTLTWWGQYKIILMCWFTNLILLLGMPLGSSLPGFRVLQTNNAAIVSSGPERLTSE